MRARETRAGGRAAGAAAPDGGFVTAESAMVLPVLALVALALLWGLYAMAVRIQCLDAARTGARAAARQDPDAAVVAATRQVAPRGAAVTVSREGDQVRVAVVARPPVPLGSLSFELREEAVASAEETLGEGTAGAGP
ncbi:TadE family type IV pilus minor pilin [Streptomyces sp. NPDC047000]|uniref:TadE family type IV pilus minor pilin n=1 Tax=Streptomyces sp. NPDC047000 TaxID=3155474 RepID=UPI00340D2D80